MARRKPEREQVSIGGPPTLPAERRTARPGRPGGPPLEGPQAPKIKRPKPPQDRPEPVPPPQDAQAAPGEAVPEPVPSEGGEADTAPARKPARRRGRARKPKSGG